MSMNKDGRPLLEEVAATYASMTSYSDVGHVSQRLQPDDPELRTEFSTLYARPNLLRFEFSRSHPYPPLRHIVTRHVVGFDGFGAYALRQEHDMPPTLQTRRDLSHAVTGSAGISSGSAHNIARLLLHEVEGLSILDLIDPRLIDDAPVDGTACHRVRAHLPKGGERVLFFERDSLLLRRMLTLQEKITTDELRRDIRVNQPIDDALFIIESPDFPGLHWPELHAPKRP
jgi:hypothetical protein